MEADSTWVRDFEGCASSADFDILMHFGNDAATKLDSARADLQDMLDAGSLGMADIRIRIKSILKNTSPCWGN